MAHGNLIILGEVWIQVKMAPYTNIKASLQFEAIKLATEIESGAFKPFDNATDADLGGMMQYVEGIDAKVPSN